MRILRKNHPRDMCRKNSTASNYTLYMIYLKLSEKEDSLEKVDRFYKGILDDKDLVISGQLEIIEDNDVIKKLKRLLLKFRSENELKFINDLKSLIEKDTEDESLDINTSNGGALNETHDDNPHNAGKNINDSREEVEVNGNSCPLKDNEDGPNRSSLPKKL